MLKMTLNGQCALTFNVAKGVVHPLLCPVFLTHSGTLSVCVAAQAFCNVLMGERTCSQPLYAHPCQKIVLHTEHKGCAVYSACLETDTDNLSKEKLSKSLMWSNILKFCWFTECIFVIFRKAPVLQKCVFLKHKAGYVLDFSYCWQIWLKSI